jgi:hypothetical protein
MDSTSSSIQPKNFTAEDVALPVSAKSQECAMIPAADILRVAEAIPSPTIASIIDSE